MPLASLERDASLGREWPGPVWTRREATRIAAPPHPAAPMEGLQRTFGNQAVQKWYPAAKRPDSPGRIAGDQTEAVRPANSSVAGAANAPSIQQATEGAPLMSAATVQRLPDGGSPDAGGAAPPTLGGGTTASSGLPAVSGTGAGGGPSPVAAPTLPSATFSRFVTAGGKLACCRPPVDCSPHLGVAKASDPVALNGMNLFFTISGHRPTVEYGIVQAKHTILCTRSGKTWTKVGETGPGAQDSPSPGATCLLPDAHGEIGMADAPGMQVPLGLPTAFPWTGVDEIRSALNLTDWVIARERPGPWKAISHFFNWHSTTRILFAGTAQLAPTGNAIGRGLMSIRGCPPF